MVFSTRELARSSSLSFLCRSYLLVLNKHLPELPSDVGIEDLGFTKLILLPWKGTQTSLVTSIKKCPVLSLVDISS